MPRAHEPPFAAPGEAPRGGGRRGDALLRLDPDDPIAVALRPLRAGETVTAGDLEVTLERDVAVGHKVALRAIPAGERIHKYRCPIGRATRAIAPGDYVHTHNLESEWIPSTLLPR